MKRLLLATALVGTACAAPSGQASNAGEGVIIYPAEAVVTMAGEGDVVEAVAVSGDRIVSTGSLASLTGAMPAAVVDPAFEDDIIVPGLIDPHVHVVLEAITLDAAGVLGLEAEIGSIEPGKRADFTILGANPLDTAGAEWDSIPVWGVVLDGVKHPLTEQVTD